MEFVISVLIERLVEVFFLAPNVEKLKNNGERISKKMEFVKPVILKKQGKEKQPASRVKIILKTIPENKDLNL